MRALLLPFGLACSLGGCTMLLGYGDEVELERDRVDGSAADASGGDATSADAAPSGPFCARATHTFCASFDQADPLAEWETGESVAAEMGRDTSSFVSEPASLRIVAERSADPGAQAPNAAVEVGFTDFSDRPFRADYGFALQIETATPADRFAVIATPLVLAPTSAPPYYLLQLIGKASADERSIQLELLEVNERSGERLRLPTTASVARGNWAQLEIQLVRSAGENSVRVTVDGAVVLSSPLTLLPSDGTPYLNLGIATMAPEPCRWVLRFDDVRADLR